MFFYSLFLKYWKYQNIIWIFIIITLNLINVIWNFIVVLDFDFAYFDFIGEPQNSYSGNSAQGGEGSSSGGGGPGHEQHVYRPESDTSRDQGDPSSSNNSMTRAKLLEKPSDNIEINTVEGAINHLEKLKQREINIRVIIAKDLNISRDIRLRDMDISFKKPLTTPIAKYLDNCRKMEDPRSRLFHKSSPGNTPVDRVLNYLRNKL